jgi:type 1 glutamine amidotransferase
MHRRQILRLSGAAIAASVFPLGFARAEDKPRRKVLFFTKSAGFEHSACHREGGELAHNERVLTDLGKEHGFDVTCSKDGTLFDGDIDQYDAFFFYTTGDLTQEGTDKQPPMSAKGKERLLAAIAGGKGFLASHCGSDTFHSAGPSREAQTELDPYIAMLGGEFISHGPQQVARQNIASKTFPGLDGLGRGFDLNDEWYSLKNFAPDLHVILAQDTLGMDGKDYERPPFPATWARKHDKGRVFYTSMGHREDVWTNPIFQQILLGGLSWAFGDVEADVTPNIDKITPGAHVMPPA